MKCKSRKLLPRKEAATGETIAVEFEENGEIINITIEVSDGFLRNFPAVSRGNIPEGVLDDLIKSIRVCPDTITEGKVIRITAAQTNPADPLVNCITGS